MELSPKQQAIDLIKKSQKVLIVGHASPGGDSVGSPLAFSEVLKGLGKEVEIIVSDSIPEVLEFLPDVNEIKKELEGSRDFVIKLDVKDKPVEKLSYDVLDGTLNVVISSKEGVYDSSDVSFGKGRLDFDLIIVLDTSDVDKIDKIYDENTELFFETPVINIDHHAGNEHFGTVNFVDVTATSTAEILVSLIEALGVKLDEKIATQLLTGIIADTRSFKKQNTTPKSLTVSAQLLAAGAKQQEIINNLYKKKPINTLKFWGKVLSSLEFDKEHRFIWSTVTYNDFKELGANVEDLREVMDELMNNAPGADVVLLLAEHEPNKITGRLHGQRGTDVLMIAELFGGAGEFHSAGFDIDNMTIGKAVEEVVGKIKEIRKQKLGAEKPDDKKRVVIPLQKLDKDSLKEVKPETVENIDEIKEALEKEEQRKEKIIERPEKEEVQQKLAGLAEDGGKEKANDAITKALDSLEKERTEREDSEKKLKKDVGDVASLGDILKGKYEEKTLGDDIFLDEDEDGIKGSENEIVHEDDEENHDIGVWRPGS